jgi:hypothetical protein
VHLILKETTLKSKSVLIVDGYALINYVLSQLPNREVHEISKFCDGLEATDSVSNQELYNNICVAPTGEARYSMLSERTLKLSTLRDIYDQRDKRQSLGTLKTRNKLDIDVEFMVDTEDPNYFFSLPLNCLDFFLLVGLDPGIDVWIPNKETDYTFSVTLNLRLQIKEFKCKNGMLGFDPSGAMLCLGQTPSQDLWLCFAEEDYLEDRRLPFQMNQPHGDTRLSKRHYRIALAYLCFCLTKLTAQSFYLIDDYPTNLFSGVTLDNIFVSNVL